MSIDVTSWWYNQALQKTQTGIKRKFYIGSDDVSDRVLKWPSVAQQSENFRAPRASLTLANQDNHFTYFVNSEPTQYETCAVEFGYTHPTSGDEFYTLIKGNVESVRLNGGKCNVTIRSRFAQLEDGTIGTPDVVVAYSDFIGNIAWDVLTVKNNLDNTATTANVDIDYASYDSWSFYWSDNNIKMASDFDGVRAPEILKKIAKYTQSAIYIQNDKIRFNLLISDLSGSYTIHIDDSNAISTGYNYDKNRKTNKMQIFAGYDITSGYHTIAVEAVNSADQSSYGVFSKSFKDKQLWYVNSLGANTAASKIKGVSQSLKPATTAKLPIIGIIPTIGDVASFEDTMLSIGSDTYFVSEYKVDLDKLETELTLDKTYLLSKFILDVSRLDGPDVLG